MRLFVKLLVIVALLYLAWNYLLPGRSQEPMISFSNKTGAFSINIREKEKGELKNYVKKIKDLVYREATVHNPPGDALPDNVDDQVINEVKEKIN